MSSHSLVGYYGNSTGKVHNLDLHMAEQHHLVRLVTVRYPIPNHTVTVGVPIIWINDMNSAYRVTHAIRLTGDLH